MYKTIFVFGFLLLVLNAAALNNQQTNQNLRKDQQKFSFLQEQAIDENMIKDLQNQQTPQQVKKNDINQFNHENKVKIFNKGKIVQKKSVEDDFFFDEQEQPEEQKEKPEKPQEMIKEIDDDFKKLDQAMNQKEKPQQIAEELQKDQIKQQYDGEIRTFNLLQTESEFDRDRLQTESEFDRDKKIPLTFPKEEDMDIQAANSEFNSNINQFQYDDNANDMDKNTQMKDLIEQDHQDDMDYSFSASFIESSTTNESDDSQNNSQDKQIQARRQPEKSAFQLYNEVNGQEEILENMKQKKTQNKNEDLIDKLNQVDEKQVNQVITEKASFQTPQNNIKSQDLPQIPQAKQESKTNDPNQYPHNLEVGKNKETQQENGMKQAQQTLKENAKKSQDLVQSLQDKQLKKEEQNSRQQVKQEKQQQKTPLTQDQIQKNQIPVNSQQQLHGQQEEHQNRLSVDSQISNEKHTEQNENLKQQSENILQHKLENHNSHKEKQAYFNHKQRHQFVHMEQGEDGETDLVANAMAEDQEGDGEAADEGPTQRNFQSDGRHSYFDPHTYEVRDEDGFQGIPAQAANYLSDQEASLVAAQLCNVPQSYEIDDGNWFRIGLVNYHRQEYSMLIAELRDMFPNATLFVAFSDLGEVCVASQEIPTKIDLEYVLFTLTGKSLNEFQASRPFFNLEQQPRATFFQLKSSFSEDSIEQTYRSRIYDFELAIAGEYSTEIIDGINIDINKVVFIQESYALLYFGEVTLQNLVSHIHFAHDQITRSENIIDLYIDVQNNQVTLHSLLVQAFGNNNANQIISDLQISRGITSLENQKLHKIILEINRDLQSFKILASNFNLVDFAISPQLELYQCSSWAVVESSMEHAQLDSLHIHCSIRQFPEFVYAHLIKTREIESLVIKLEDAEYTFREFYNNVVSKLNGEDRLQYQRSLSRIFDLDNTYIHKVDISVQFAPKLMYVIDGEIGVPEWQNIGNFQIVLCNINERMRSFLQIHFGPEPFEHFFSRVVRHDFPESMASKSTLLFFSSVALDLSEYEHLQIEGFGPYDRDFWNRGIYIQHVFDIKSECRHSQMCKLIQERGLPNTNLHVKGYVRDFDEDFTLYGEISDFNMAENLDITEPYIALPMRVTQDEQARDENVALNDLYILGNFQIPLDEGDFIPFKGILFYNWASQGILMNQDQQQWESAFGFHQLNVNQLKVKGFVNREAPYDVQYFTMTGLGIFGEQCFYETADGRINFERDTCFYGNINIKIDFMDYSNSFYEGFFTDISMLEVMTVLMDYDALVVYDKIHRSILETRIIRGCTISYAQKNIVDNIQQLILIPQGVTVQSSVQFFGLDGSLVMNIYDNKLVGVFHFSTVSLANGNIVIFEENLEDSNNIILRIEPDMDTKDDQIIFHVKANIFDEDRDIYLFISELDGYSIEINDELFGCSHLMNLHLTAPYEEHLPSAQFQATVDFTESHLEAIQNQVKHKILDWMGKIEDLLTTLHSHVDSLESILNEQRSKLCEQEACPYEQECVSIPQRRCSKYRQRQICDVEETYCINIVDQCVNEVEECMYSEDVCLDWVSNSELRDSGEPCNRWETQCQSYVTLCREYRQVCASERITTCASYQFVDDLNECEEYHYGCETQYVPDSTCQQECQRREESFQYYADLFETQWDSLNRFETRLVRYQALANEVKLDQDGFLQIVRAGFVKDLSQPIRSRDFQVDFKVMSFGRGLLGEDADVDTFEIQNYDFSNEAHMSQLLFRQIVERWAQYYDFDPIIISNDPSELIESIFGDNLNQDREYGQQIIEYEHEEQDTQEEVSDLVSDISQDFQDNNDQSGNFGERHLDSRRARGRALIEKNKTQQDVEKSEQIKMHHNHELISLYHLVSKSIKEDE